MRRRFAPPSVRSSVSVEQLQYHFPESPLVINVDMGSHDQVMAAFDKFADLGKKKFSRLKFRLTTKKRGENMFRLDKPKTVKMRLDNRNNINMYLAQDFVKGRIEISTYSQIMGSKLVDAKGLLGAFFFFTITQLTITQYCNLESSLRSSVNTILQPCVVASLLHVASLLRPLLRPLLHTPQPRT